MKRPIRVLLVDDNRMFTDAVELIVSGDPEISIVGVAGSVDDALQLSIRRPPHVVLMDIGLVDAEALAATRRIHDGWPQAGVVVMSASDDPRRVREAVLAGAADHLTKTRTVDELLSVIKRVAAPPEDVPAPDAHAAY